MEKADGDRSSWQPQYVWRHTEEDGILPFSGFTNDIKLNSTEKKQAAKGSSKENQSESADQGTIELFGVLKQQ